MTNIETATHGEPAGQGRRGTWFGASGDSFYLEAKAGSRRFFALDPARVTMGHSHDPTPRPFWRRWWMRLRGKWPPRGGFVAGYSVKFDYETGPVDWRPHQLAFYELAARVKEVPAVLIAPSALGKTVEPAVALDEYCARDVEMTRRLRIVFTQPAAWIDDDGSVAYDPYHWTGRRE